VSVRTQGELFVSVLLKYQHTELADVNITINFLCFVDRASRYICVIKTNLMHYLPPVYFFNQPLHVSDIFVAHHQEA